MTTYKVEISIVKPEIRDADGKIVSYKTEEEIYTQYVSELNVVDVVAVVNQINSPKPFLFSAGEIDIKEING